MILCLSSYCILIASKFEIYDRESCPTNTAASTSNQGSSQEIVEQHDEEREFGGEEQDEDQELPGLEDPAFQHRAAARERYERHDNAYGRFVLRRIEDMTRQDRAYLSSGNSNLVQLATIHAGLLEEGFLNAIFEGDWKTVAAPTSRPMKPARVAADSTVPCGVFIRDSYS